MVGLDEHGVGEGGVGKGKKGSRWGSRVAEKAHGGVEVDGQGTPADTWGVTQHW